MKKPRRERRADRDDQSGLRLYAQLGLRIPGELAIRLKRYCQESGVSVNATVTEALEEFLSRRKA